MSLTEKDIRHIAKLSAIEVSDADVEMFKNELNDILSYVETLSKLDTENVHPTLHVHGAVNAFRDDVIKDSFTKEEVAKLSPNFSSEGFKVPKII